MESERKVLPFPGENTEDEIWTTDTAPEINSENTENGEETLDIDYAPGPEADALWDALFPNGKPTPEEFIQKLAQLLKP